MFKAFVLLFTNEASQLTSANGLLLCKSIAGRCYIIWYGLRIYRLTVVRSRFASQFVRGYCASMMILDMDETDVQRSHGFVMAVNSE